MKQATLQDRILAVMTRGGLTSETLAVNAITFANQQLGGHFRLGGAGYPGDGSRPIHLWMEKGLNGYQVYLHDLDCGATSVIEDITGKPLRIRPL